MHTMNARNKQLAAIDVESVRLKVQHEQGLTLAEASVYYDLPYSSLRAWKREGLPLVAGKLFHSDFVIWRRRLTGLESMPQAAVHPSGRGVGKSGGLLSRRG